MLWGITGSHRAGKTTLAKALAEDLGITFHETSTTKVARELGFDPVAPMTLRERVDLQILLLGHHLETIDALPRPLIVDRTPLDFLAYTMCEFGMQSVKMTEPDVLEAAESLYEACLNATRLRYDFLYHLEPLSTYLVDNSKATPDPNRAFQIHYSLVMKGALYSLGGEVEYVSIQNEDFDFRREWVHDSIVERMNDIEKMALSAPFH